MLQFCNSVFYLFFGCGLCISSFIFICNVFRCRKSVSWITLNAGFSTLEFSARLVEAIAICTPMLMYSSSSRLNMFSSP